LFLATVIACQVNVDLLVGRGILKHKIEFQRLASKIQFERFPIELKIS
jgi:hypothetical protein